MPASSFSGYFQELDSLTTEQKDGLKMLVFCNRLGFNSVTVMARDKNIFKSIAGEYADLITRDATRYFVDLQSLSSQDKVRIYADYSEPTVEFEGYYIDSQKSIYEKKIYRKVSSDHVDIERYDMQGNRLTDSEPEIKASESDWTGPQGLVEAAKNSGHLFWFLKKTLKDQNYLVVFL